MVSLVHCYGQYNQDYRVQNLNPHLISLYASFEKTGFSDEVDSLFLNRFQILDGCRIVYWHADKKIPRYKFNILDGNINGPFYCWNENGILTTVGSYREDSLWTFRDGYFLLGDTTFKVGRWRYYALQDPLDSTYNSAFTIDQNYKIPYDSLGLYTEHWTFLNNNLWEFRRFNIKRGLIFEQIFNADSSRYSDFELLENCSIYRKWDEEGNLKWICLKDKMDFILTFDVGDNRFGLNEYVKTKDELINQRGENVQTRLFYSNGELMEFSDWKAGIKIRYNEDGNVVKIEKMKGVKVKTVRF